MSQELPLTSGTDGHQEEQKLGPITPPLSSASSNSPTVTGSPRSKGIVMGSFSERLKRIRENRSTDKSQLLKGSPSPKTNSPLLRGSPSPRTTSPLTGNIAERLSSTKQTSGSDLLVSPLTSFPTSPALSTQSTSSSLSYGGSTPPISTTTLPTNNLETFSAEALTSKNIGNVQMDTLTDPHTQPVAVVSSSSEITTDASESFEQDKLQKDARDLLHTEVSESSLNSEATTEGTEPSNAMQQDTDPLSYERSPPQLEKKSNVPIEENDDDELPTAPPPPIPDLPPPPDDLPLEMDPEEPVESSTQSSPAVASEVAKPATVTTKSSFRTIKKKEEWTRKSAELDSLMMDPLPLLISTKTSNNRLPDSLPELNESPSQTRNEYPQQIDGETEKMTNDNVLHGSSESLPSLPETPPPELPDAPPPDLPSSFSLDGIEFESDALEEKVISETLLLPSEDGVKEESEATTLSLPTLNTSAPTTDIASELLESKPESQPISSPESTPPLGNEQSPAIHSDKVQLRKPKRPANGTSLQDVNLQRRSAFDALVAVEPTAEDKKEPKLSADQRRSLALESSRRSDADTSPLLEHWKISIPSAQADAKKEKDEEDLDQTKEPVEAVERPGSEKVTTDVNSPPTEGTKPGKDLLSIRELNPVRPRSIAGFDDLQPSLKHKSDDESRWSLPPGSEIFQSINVIPDLAPKLTGETKAKWNKPHLLTADGNPSLSASTGQLFSKGRDTSQDGNSNKAGKSSSWRTLHSSSESLPHFVGLPKKSPNRQTQPFAISPLAANVSVASNSSKEELVSQTTKEESAEVHQESLQEISYAQKLQVQSRASARKRRSLVMSEDDQTPTSVENTLEDSLLAKVPLRRKVQNLQLASVMAERDALDSPRPASLVLDRDILRVRQYLVF